MRIDGGGGVESVLYEISNNFFTHFDELSKAKTSLSIIEIGEIQAFRAHIAKQRIEII